MRVAITLFACVFVCAAIASAESQSVQKVSVCDLRQHAGDFDHKVVEVRGRADLDFENFTLHDPQCKDSTLTPVWLTFGGDVSDIAVYCCGNHSRERGHDLRIDGHSVPLMKDVAYQQFEKLLRASRNRMPNGAPCSTDCHFYRVSATLTGVFLAAKNTATEHTGYGHLGCCSLLIIERVRNVSATRTGMALGTFNCEKAEWTATAEEIPELENYLLCFSHCDQEGQSAIRRVAAHWNDAIVVSTGDFRGTYSGPGPAFHLAWTSEDLLKTYTVAGERAESQKFSITRETCQLRRDRIAPIEPITCDEYTTEERWTQRQQLEFEEHIEKGDVAAAENMRAESAEQLSSKGNQSWRTKPLRYAAQSLVRRETAHWGVTVDSDLQADKCTDAGLDEQQYSYNSCSWYSLDGMQEFTVNLMKKKGEARSPWLLNSLNARICHSDPSLAKATIH